MPLKAPKPNLFPSENQRLNFGDKAPNPSFSDSFLLESTLTSLKNSTKHTLADSALNCSAPFPCFQCTHSKQRGTERIETHFGSQFTQRKSSQFTQRKSSQFTQRKSSQLTQRKIAKPPPFRLGRRICSTTPKPSDFYLKIYASAISVFTPMLFGATFFTTETKTISNATRFSIGKTAVTG